MKKITSCRSTRHFLAITLTLNLLLPLLCGCGSSQQSVSKSGFYFDTIITVTLYGTSNAGLIDKCFALASEYERKLSNTIKDSDVSQINANAGHFVEVSDETLELVSRGIYYGELSDGMFDITVGKLSELWNIPEIAKNLATNDNVTDSSAIPSSEEIRKALAHINYQNIEIDGNKVRLKDASAALDLGGIAKGFIADKMREYLRKEGVTAGIINLGGNVLTLGKKTEEEVYSIGIQKPFADSGTSLGTLTVKDASVVSSGVYERYYRVDDKLYHHILDTRTGFPVENDLYQVTIISKSSVDGDALSTACFAMGLTDGLAFVESLTDTEAIFVTSDGTLYLSSGFGKEITFTEA